MEFEKILKELLGEMLNKKSEKKVQIPIEIGHAFIEHILKDGIEPMKAYAILGELDNSDKQEAFRQLASILLEHELKGTCGCHECLDLQDKLRAAVSGIKPGEQN